jgi:hypothetical protein
MQTVELMNAMPSIHVRLENGTPEAAADLVRYTNIVRDYDVRYWYIGNEPNLFDDYTVAQYVVEWRTIAEAMREVDPDIVLIGPEVSQWNGTPQVDPVDPEGVDWLRGFLQANGDIVDVIAVHRYPFPCSRSPAGRWTGTGGRRRTYAAQLGSVSRWVVSDVDVSARRLLSAKNLHHRKWLDL